jgi:hypothetical protein
MNSFTLECSFHGKKTEGVNGIIHLTLDEMRNCGRTLIEVLENYKPSE